jgi:cellulose synthase/poly-beta-1,6-N-acetylglucosamine synthase-like glycosyltransferase
MARGKIIAFLDDDVVARPEWAAEVVRTLDEDSSVVGVAGAVIPMWAHPSMSWFPEEFYWVIGCTGFLGWKRTTETGHAATVNAAYTREALKCAGLFNPSLGLVRAEWGKHTARWREVGGEDGELSMRVRRITGRRIVFAPSALVLHRVMPERLRPMAIAQRSWAVGRERKMFRMLFSREERTVLFDESILLRRILFDLSPRILRGFLTSPSNSWRQLGVVIVSLVFAGFGYMTYPLLKPR